jgi:HEAT repeat protein
MRHAFATDSSYVVAGAALRGLVKADSANTLPLCLEALGRDSRYDQVRSSGLRSLASYKSVPGVMDTVQSYTLGGRPRNMRVLAVSLLAKNWPTDDVLGYVAGLLDDPVFHVRRAAIDALGAAGNEDSIEPLRRRLAVEPNERLRQSILDAVKKIEDLHQ